MHVKKVYKRSKVHCITVPSGIFRVRRNGKECWTGNSNRETGLYTQDAMPAKGSGGQAKRIGGLEINALLSHGAIENLKDVMLIRGNRNEDYWNALKFGKPIPTPEVPFIYNKFINLLKAGGVNVRRDRDTQQLATMTDADVDRMAHGEIETSDTVDSHTLNEKRGGLFDPGVTGGSTGKKWGKITLANPIPNPVMEEPIKKLLGITGKQYRAILAGTEELNGMTGGEAIKSALGGIDIDNEIRRNKNEIRHKRGAARDAAVKKLRYLSAVKKTGVSPEDWVISKIPVIPPVFRPISQMGDTLLVSDMNDLYRDVIEMNNSVKELSGDLSGDALAKEKLDLYDSVKAVYGWGDPITPEARSKRLKGAARQIMGDNPKHGLAQSKLLSKTVDLVSRGVVTPDPDLDMDTVGIPEKTAWEVYSPFVQRRLVQRGIPPVRAREMIKDQSKEAKEELLNEMDKRPILLNRAPSWHKYNIMAFNPVLVDDDTIHTSPLIVTGFNMDFDGDATNIHVPASDKAVAEAKDILLPSKNLFSGGDLKSLRHEISKEMLLGLYHMTREPSKKQPVVFRTLKEAREAYNHGLIAANDPIVIRDSGA